MSDQELLAGYIATWNAAIDDFVGLLEELRDDDWHKPTDLPGWSVHAVAAHIAHLEGILAGAPEETVEIGEPAHVTSLMGMYTEQGVVARRDASGADLIAEIRNAADVRRAEYAEDMPTDGTAKPARIFGGIGWDNNTLLRNRPLDVWMHEQDIRRAVGKPGGMNSAAAEHTATYLSESLPFVVGKRVGAPSNTTVVLAVEGSPTVTAWINEAGRGMLIDGPDGEPDVRIDITRESFIEVAGGRREPAAGTVTIAGDQALAATIMANFGVTP